MVKVRVSEMPPLLLLLLVAASWTGAAALTSDELRVIMESAAEAAVHSEESDSSEESSSELPLLATLPAPPLPPPTPTLVSSRSDPLAVEQTRVVYPRYLPAPAHGTAPTPTNSHAQGVAHGSPTAPPPPLGPTPHTPPDGSVRDWISALTALAVEAEKAPPGMTLAVHGAGAAGTAASPGEVGALIAPYATRPSRAAEAAQTIEYSKYPPAYAPYSPYRGYRYYPSAHVMGHMYPGHYAPRPHYPPPPPMAHMGRYPRHYMAGMYRSRVPPCMAAEEAYADPEVYRG